MITEKVHALMEQVSGVQAMIAALNAEGVTFSERAITAILLGGDGSGNGATPPAGSNGRQGEGDGQSKKSVPEIVRDILRESKQPMRLPDLVDEVSRRRGKTTTLKSLSTFYAFANTKGNGIKRVGKGTYKYVGA